MSAKYNRRYFALHEAGLRNGSFFRVSRYGCHQFINGDHIGEDHCGAGPLVDGIPTTYGKQSLVEFEQEVAEKLIPKVCL